MPANMKAVGEVRMGSALAIRHRLVQSGELMATRKKTDAVVPPAALPSAIARVVTIPATFSLAGVQWKVVDVDHLPDLGNCERDIATINLRSGLSPQIRAATFFHELVHAILYTTGLVDTEHKEKDVDIFGALLHQYELTKGFNAA